MNLSTLPLLFLLFFLKLRNMWKVLKAIQNYKTSWLYQAKSMIVARPCSPSTGHLQDYYHQSNREKFCREHFMLLGILFTYGQRLNYTDAFSSNCRENFLEGSVNVDGREKSILLQGYENLNRAVDGDSVAVELFPEDLWTAPSGVVLEDQEDYDPGMSIPIVIFMPEKFFPSYVTSIKCVTVCNLYTPNDIYFKASHNIIKNTWNYNYVGCIWLPVNYVELIYH